MLKLLLHIIIISNLSIATLLAQESQDKGEFHGQYVEWSLFSNKQGSKIICYMTAIPFKKSGNAYNRGESYIIVTKTKEKLPEISIAAGYYYKKNSQVELSFGLKKFSMLTYKDQSWTYSIDDDIEIIKAMRNSDDVVISTISAQNKTSTDSYSLTGFDRAYQELQKICK